MVVEGGRKCPTPCKRGGALSGRGNHSEMSGGEYVCENMPRGSVRIPS